MHCLEKAEYSEFFSFIVGMMALFVSAVRGLAVRGSIVALLVMIGGGGHLTIAQAASPVPPHEVFKEEGLWLVEDGDGVFYIGPCISAEAMPANAEGRPQLCGWLVGLDYTEATPPKDIWGRSECNAALVTGMYRIGNEKWHGHVLDPRSGHVYNANLWLDKNDKLKLHGYVGFPFLGQTQTWTRYKGPAIGPDCRMSK